MRRALALLILLPWVGGPAESAWSATQTVEFTVKAGKHDRENEVVCVPLQLPAELRSARAQIKEVDRVVGPGQLAPPSLRTGSIPVEKGKVRADLWFVLPKLRAGESTKLTAVLDTATPPDAKNQFHWQDGKGADDLRFGERPVLRYVRPELDETTLKKREETFKVFHHVYSPKGDRLLTKGVGGLFTHHRGLFYGFMRVTHDGVVDDIWHCKGDAYQGHEKVLEEAVGPVLGRHRVQIGWHGKGKEVFATEQRELTAYHLPGGTLIEFASLLTPPAPIKLDGDPQHAGFHFRADNAVADKTPKQTIYIRPDGTDRPGVTRNWDGNKNKTHVNLPWLGMSFVLGDQRYTAAYLDRPTNPKEARFSEREYGRFGSYFVTEVTPKKPLLVNYRVWIQEGQMTGDEIARADSAFVEPVEVEVVRP
jgi:hypothetical protein